MDNTEWIFLVLQAKPPLAPTDSAVSLKAWILKEFIGKGLIDVLDERQPYLSNLLKNKQLPVYYNTHPYQEDKKGVNTCGRWCVVRCIYANKNNKSFHDIIRRAKKKGMTGDEFVSGLTARWLKK